MLYQFKVLKAGTHTKKLKQGIIMKENQICIQRHKRIENKGNHMEVYKTKLIPTRVLTGLDWPIKKTPYHHEQFTVEHYITSPQNTQDKYYKTIYHKICNENVFTLKHPLLMEFTNHDLNNRIALHLSNKTMYLSNLLRTS